VAGGGFEQCYNAQAVAAADGLLVVATDPRPRITSGACPKRKPAPDVIRGPGAGFRWGKRGAGDQ
jgi:hypothetical protein